MSPAAVPDIADRPLTFRLARVTALQLISGLPGSTLQARRELLGAVWRFYGNGRFTYQHAEGTTELSPLEGTYVLKLGVVHFRAGKTTHHSTFGVSSASLAGELTRQGGALIVRMVANSGLGSVPFIKVFHGEGCATRSFLVEALVYQG